MPDRLPDLPAREVVRRLEMPLDLDWSRPGRIVDLADLRQRARAHEVVLREGRPVDIESIIDGALLVDLWTDLVLPRRLRTAWQPSSMRRLAEVSDSTLTELQRVRNAQDRALRELVNRTNVA